ncbi:MAG: hypothetical protein QM689_03825 [Oscillospiraceae bacterium]
MLEILKTKQPARYAALFEKLGLTQSNPEVSEATDGDTVTGFAVYHFNFSGENPLLSIDYLSEELPAAVTDGLVRSVLFLAMLRGVEQAHFCVENTAQISRLGFVTDAKKYVDSISDFMGKCKNCGTVE